METILALDIGTSSTRAVLFDADDCAPISGAEFAVPHEPDATPDGGAWLDADALVEEAVECAARALAAAPGADVAAVALSTFWHSAVGVDGEGRARTPILLWADRRSAEQVARLRAEMDPAAYSERTGCPMHTSYLAGRLRWLAETDPDAFRASVRFLSPGEYLFARLFGPDRVSCSVSMASATGLMDQKHRQWDPQTLAHLPGMTPERLSPIGDDPVHGLRAPFADALPALADVPWFPALGDGACSNLGCGATGPDRLALMIGTSGALRVVAGAVPPATPPGLWRYQADAGRFLVGGALSNGGSVWAWLKDRLQLPALSAEEREAAIRALSPDAHGLTVLPFFQGERAPNWRDDARATITGLSAATTPLEIVRAHLEAVAYRFAAIRDRLRAAAPGGAIIGTGAGLKASPAWAQILADVLHEPLIVSAEDQASSRGAALWARERIGRGPIETAPFPLEARFEPNAAHAGLYATARARHEDLYRRLMPPG